MIAEKSYYEIRAWNQQTIVFWGTEDDAEKYCDWINRHQEVNLYEAKEVPENLWDSYEDNTEVVSAEDPHWDDFMV